MGSDYWSGLVDWIRGAVLESGKVAPADLGLISVTDDVDEAVSIVLHGHDAARLADERAAHAALVVAEGRAAGGPSDRA